MALTKEDFSILEKFDFEIQPVRFLFDTQGAENVILTGCAIAEFTPAGFEIIDPVEAGIFVAQSVFRPAQKRELLGTRHVLLVNYQIEPLTPNPVQGSQPLQSVAQARSFAYDQHPVDERMLSYCQVIRFLDQITESHLR